MANRLFVLPFVVFYSSTDVYCIANVFIYLPIGRWQLVHPSQQYLYSQRAASTLSLPEARRFCSLMSDASGQSVGHWSLVAVNSDAEASFLSSYGNANESLKTTAEHGNDVPFRSQCLVERPWQNFGARNYNTVRACK